MKIFRLFLVFGGLFILTFPVGALAHNFTTGNGLFFNANSGLYRQKTVERPWQLVDLPSDSTVIQAVSFNERMWLVVETNAKQYLWRQNQLLNFSPVDAIAPATQIVLKLTENHLTISRRDVDKSELFVFNSSGTITKLVPPLGVEGKGLERVLEFNNQLIYLEQSAPDTVSVFHQRGSAWNKITSIDCAQSRLFETPIVGLHCLDGTIFYPVSTDRWSRLNLAPVERLANSTELLGGYDRQDERLFHIWQSGTATDLRLPTLARGEVEMISVHDRRILLKKTAGNWFELLWQTDSPKLVELTDTNTGEVIPVIGSTILLINGATPQLSASAASWQIIVATGSFTTARQTPLGLLVWNLGSLTQFAPTGSTIFSKVNPWSSTTSPIQAVEIGPSASFVSVITQSGKGNVNLYKTTDFLRWTRVTLPTKPTVSPTISQARQLAPGSLVELSGVITVGPKVVDSEVLYLEDAPEKGNGGIQIYLNQTSGSLPTTPIVNAVATGIISTSQTKRVILDSLTDLELGGLVNWTEPMIGPDEVARHLGRSVRLKGNVETTETDYLKFRQIAGSLKLHYAGAKTLFRPDDQLVVPAVVDWNSASGQNEAWALSSDYQLLFRAEPARETVTSPVVIEASMAVAPKKTATAKNVKSLTPAVKSSPTVAPARTPKPAETPVIVSSAQTRHDSSDRQTVSIGAVSLIAGLLSVRGRRFRRLLAH